MDFSEGGFCGSGWVLVCNKVDQMGQRSQTPGLNRLGVQPGVLVGFLTLLLRQMTGHRLKPSVQQQHRQPHSSHRTFTGRVFLRQLFTRYILALNSSGATLRGSIDTFEISHCSIFLLHLCLQKLILLTHLSC